MTSSVSLVSCKTYDLETVKVAVHDALAPHGEFSSFVRPGMSVLLKPNLLNASPPERCVTTHPAVFEAVAQLCIDHGAKVITGDCCGYGSPGDKMRASGIGAVSRRLGAEIVKFDGAVRLEPHASNVHRRIEVARQVVEADAIINLPKLKTHCQMLLTGAVKNLFGCVVGARKPQWHIKSTGERLYFGMMLVELYEHLAPALTVVDGVIGHEGNGPANGQSRPFGVILAGTDCVAIDVVIARMLGVEPSTVPVLQAAQKLGVGAWSPEQIEICGERLEDHAIRDLKLPKMMDIDFPLPQIAKRLARHALLPRPYVDQAACTLCNECVTVCPTDVMRVGGERLEIDYDGCINCFLCEDVCPEDAIFEKTGLLGKLLAPSAVASVP